MSEPEFRPLEPAHYRRSVFGGYVERDDGPACTRMEVGDRRPDGSVVVGVVPVDPSTERHRAQDELRKAMVELNFTDDELAAYVASFDAEARP